MPDYGDHDPNRGRYEYEGMVDPNAPSVANGRITPAQWAQYQARRRRNAILGILGVAGATTGLGFLGQALTGAGGAASSALPAGYVPGWEGNTNLLGFGANLGGATAPLASTPFGAAAPYAGSATASGTGAGGAGAAGAAGAGAAAGGMSLRDWIALGMSGAGAVGGALSNPPNYAPNTATTDPNILRLIQTMQGRLDKSEPLYDSIMAMANGLLPTQYQRGGGGMR